jgi:acyl-CoA carboxylase subunit beta
VKVSDSTPHARAALDSVATHLVELEYRPVSTDPLEWPGYQDDLEAARARSGESESVVTAEGSISGQKATLIAFEFDFLGGSIGEAAGKRITSAIAHARAHGQPLVSLIASGGARVQEGMRSLLQLQRITASIADARRAGVPHISVVRDPTLGGAWVSLASNADVILAVARANVGLAGARIRTDDSGSRQFTADGKQGSGFIDVIAEGHRIPTLLERYVELLGNPGRTLKPCPLPEPVGVARAHRAAGWQAVERARSTRRPRAAQYLSSYFDERVPISGDRVSGKDDAMLCGLGRRDGRTIAYAAQTGRPNTPAGFRTVTRLVRLAERFRLPVLTLIDTPGAAHGASAERGGIGTAIGETLAAMSELSVPVTSVVIGEGGSGGALALAGPGALWATSDSYFSVIAPEGAASILYRDVGRASEVAGLLRLAPADLVELGVIDGICGS